NAEVAARSRRLIRYLEVRPLVTAGLLKAIPDAPDRLAASSMAWAEILLEATAFVPKTTGLRFPFLVKRDLEFLAAQALKHAADSKQRQDVIHRINQWRFKTGAAELMQYIDDPDEGVSRAVWNALRMTGPETTPALIGFLKHENVQIRQGAVGLLVERRERVALPHIREMVEKGPPEQKAYALTYLINFEGTAGARKDVLKYIDELKPESAARILGMLGDVELAPRLHGLIRDKDEYVRRAARGALVRLNARQYFDEFVRMLDDPNEEEDLRYLASAAVAAMGTAEHGEKFLFMLKDPDKQKRLTGVARLTQLDAPEHAKHLVPMLEDSHPSVRVYAASGLCSLGSNDVEAILPLLDPKDAAFTGDPVGPAEVVVDMAMRSGKEVQDRVAAYFRKLEENPAMGLATIASISLVRMGLKDRAAQRTLIERVDSSPMFRQYGGFLCDSLALAHEPRLRERIDSKRVIETRDDLNEVLKPSGLRAEFEGPVRERIREGRTLTAYQVVRRACALSMTVEKGVIRFAGPRQTWASVEQWGELLK
ncbi:MAG TPA: HEAT repeat domain-containing protein, partial [Planctomycetota bacterium]|nr:HEAT repeat domain-containing protein [Planctomycetota bacterium]